MKEKPSLKPVCWLGDTLKMLRSFPNVVQSDIGQGLFLVQIGQIPKDAKHLTGMSGVIEIVTRFDGETYRTVYTTKIANKVYVLHIFQKKAKSGIKTPQQDIDLIVTRLKEAHRRESIK
jgi:phage-related protein